MPRRAKPTGENLAVLPKASWTPFPKADVDVYLSQHFRLNARGQEMN
jgi:hypothetical protein